MSWSSERARLAALKRHRPADDPAIAETTRDLAAERLADFVRRTVEALPPLTDAQLDRVAVLLRPGPEERGGETS